MELLALSKRHVSLSVSLRYIVYDVNGGGQCSPMFIVDGW